MFHIKQISCCLFPTYSWHCTFRAFLFALASCRSWLRIQITGTICFSVTLCFHHLSNLTKPSLDRTSVGRKPPFNVSITFPEKPRQSRHGWLQRSWKSNVKWTSVFKVSCTFWTLCCNLKHSVNHPVPLVTVATSVKLSFLAQHTL